MEYMSFSRLFMAVSLILIYVIQKLVGLAHQTSPGMNLKPIQHVDDMDMRHLAFEDQLQFIDSDDYMLKQQPVTTGSSSAARAASSNRNTKLLDGDEIQLDSISISYLSVSVLLFELNERQGCLESANYSVIRTFSAVNVGQMVLKIRGFKIGSPSTASNILRGRLYNIAKSKQQAQHNNVNNNQFNNQNKVNTNNHNHHRNPSQNNHQASSSSSSSSHHKLSNHQQPHYQHHHLNHHQHQSPDKTERDYGDDGFDEQHGSICQGYGFTIYDCEPFDLEPNREHKIRISFNPDFTLTKTIVSLTIYTNMDEEFKFALVASIPRSSLASCNRQLPRPDWEPTLQLVLPTGMVIMVLVSILTAYMEAMLYLRSQQATTNQTTISQTVTQSNHHSGGSNNKDYNNERNHSCSNHSGDTCNKDRTNGNGHGAASSAISATISSQSTSSSSQLNGLTQANGNNTNNNTKTPSNNKQNNKSNNSLAQKRRKNSSTVNSEKAQANNSGGNNKSSSLGSSSASDKKSSSPYAPIFQNLTNVIASPPPPLPTFDSEFDPLEFKKLRGKRSSKKSNSLNGSVAGSDDVANPNSLGSTCGPIGSGKGSRANGKLNGLKLMSDDSISLNGERDSDLQAQLERSSHRSNSQTNRKSTGGLRDVFTSTSMSDEDSCPENKLYNNSVDGIDHKNRKLNQQQQQQLQSNQHEQKRNHNHQHQVNNKRQNQEQPVGAQLPIQPPSSTSSSSAASLASSSSPSSTSSSPPLSATSYGEYSLLGPGASFELPCLRVRSK